MLEKEPSRAATNPEVTPRTSGAPLGGPFPPAAPPAAPPAEATADAPCPLRQFTLQYLIAAIKKPSK